jgi:hypothetical protein
MLVIYLAGLAPQALLGCVTYWLALPAYLLCNELILHEEEAWCMTMLDLWVADACGIDAQLIAQVWTVDDACPAVQK